MSNIIHLAGRSPSALATRLHGPEARTGHAPIYPTASISVGQREGRLSERSPADRSRAAQAGYHTSVQGDRLSHSFSSFAATVAETVCEISKSFTFFLICLFGGLVITGAALSPFIYWKFFSHH